MKLIKFAASTAYPQLGSFLVVTNDDDEILTNCDKHGEVKEYVGHRTESF